MYKNINYLGVIKLPWKKFFSSINDKETKVEYTYEKQREKSFSKYMNPKEAKLTVEIGKKYPSSSQLFYRYTNPKYKDWIPEKIWKKIGIKKDSAKVQIMRHNPGTCTIPHIDRYISFIGKKLNKNTNPKKIKKIESMVNRVWITMTKPKLGHALFFGNEVAYWLKQGTALSFNKKIYHSGGNMGYEDRYVLTITGWKDGQ